MKIETNNIQETLKKKLEKATELKTTDGLAFKDIMSSNFTGISGLLANFNNDNTLNDFLKSDDIKELRASYKYDCMTMDRDDATFFANAIKGENYGFSVNGQLLMENMNMSAEAVGKTYKSAEVSKTLMDMLFSSQHTNKPVRIDFGNDISAVLRVSQDGKISAKFIPSDKVAEEYLKNNISYLQQTFEEQDIPYNELSYKQRQKDKQNQNQSKNQEKQGDKGES